MLRKTHFRLFLFALTLQFALLNGVNHARAEKIKQPPVQASEALVPPEEHATPPIDVEPQASEDAQQETAPEIAENATPEPAPQLEEVTEAAAIQETVTEVSEQITEAVASAEVSEAETTLTEEPQKDAPQTPVEPTTDQEPAAEVIPSEETAATEPQEPEASVTTDEPASKEETTHNEEPIVPQEQEAEAPEVEAAPAEENIEKTTLERIDPDAPKRQYAVALHGSPKLPEDFKHLNYVNPDAPKGGTLRLSSIGSFDSLNPFIIKGQPAAGINANYMRSGIFYTSLMQNTWDEPFSLYGIIAKNITIAPDKSWVRFELRDEAKWNDGKDITAEDVVWTFKTLVEHGQPFFKAYWHDVESVVPNHDKSVTFNFSVNGNAELPLIIAEMVVLPKHYWTAEGRDFTKTILDPPLGSGPYLIGKVNAGQSIEYVRNENWWGKDLPFFKGMYNFDRIIYDYYKDADVAHEAFLSGNFDVKIENSAKTWNESYNPNKERAEHLIKEELENQRPAGMQAFVYNIRRPVFQNKLVRKALSYAFDFEWSNKQFAYGDYVRTNSYYENSELASSGLPSEAELAILNPIKDKIPPEVFTEEFKAPVTDGSGKMRQNLRTTVKILEDAGYTKFNENGIRTNGSQALEFEILLVSPLFERWVQPFIKNLERIGVKANIRVLQDTAQYQNRLNTFDFDVIIGTYGQSNSPGNEQREFWGSDRADMDGSRNYIGVKEPVIDELVTQIIHATSREDLVTKTRALDRILLWNHYIIPMWHYPKWRLAYWDHIARPETLSDISPLIIDTWWYKGETTEKTE